MEMLIDASIVMATLLNEPEKPTIVTLTTGQDLAAPAVLPYEIGNALSSLARRGRLTAEQVNKGYSLFTGIPIRLLEPDMNKSLRLAAEFSIFAYDAYYLETAVRHNFPLLTLDRQMLRLAEELNIKTPEVSDESV